MDYTSNKQVEDFPNEKWASSPVGLSGYYEISNYGRVKRVARYGERYGKSFLIPEIIMAARKDNNGYYFLGLSISKKGLKTKKVHNLVADAFIPNKENKKCVNHKNGIKADNRVENLEWATHQENSIHALKNGLVKPAFGENHHNSKLRVADVLCIRATPNGNKVHLAKKYNVSRGTICLILYNKTWKNC